MTGPCSSPWKWAQGVLAVGPSWWDSGLDWSSAVENTAVWRLECLMVKEGPVAWNDCGVCLFLFSYRVGGRDEQKDIGWEGVQILPQPQRVHGGPWRWVCPELGWGQCGIPGDGGRDPLHGHCPGHMISGLSCSGPMAWGLDGGLGEDGAVAEWG